MYFTHQLFALSRLRVTLLPVLLVALVAGCASSRTAAWPKPQIDYTHAATHAQARQLINAWRGLGGRFDSHASLTGSMLPHIHGGPREFLLFEVYSGQPLQPGHVVDFYRDAKVPRCLHMIAAIRGDYVYLSGTNNRWSDGWFHRAKINAILREVVTLPSPGIVPTKAATSTAREAAGTDPRTNTGPRARGNGAAR